MKFKHEIQNRREYNMKCECEYEYEYGTLKTKEMMMLPGWVYRY
jgi:hypothetical protein